MVKTANEGSADYVVVSDAVPASKAAQWEAD